jgi:hypothetical protein
MNGEFVEWSKNTVDVIETHYKQNTEDHNKILDFLKKSSRKVYMVLISIFLLSLGLDIILFLFYINKI